MLVIVTACGAMLLSQAQFNQGVGPDGGGGGGVTARERGGVHAIATRRKNIPGAMSATNRLRDGAMPSPP